MLINKNDYLVAEQNGIPKKTVQSRVYVNGWEVERAVSQPVQRQNELWPQWKDRCLVSMNSFYRRMKEGMTPEQAALTPPIPRSERNSKCRKPALVNSKTIEQAKQMGMSEHTLKYRIYYLKWSVEKALNTPVNINKRRKDLR